MTTNGPAESPDPGAESPDGTPGHTDPYDRQHVAEGPLSGADGATAEDLFSAELAAELAERLDQVDLGEYADRREALSAALAALVRRALAAPPPAGLLTLRALLACAHDLEAGEHLAGALLVGACARVVSAAVGLARMPGWRDRLGPPA